MVNEKGDVMPQSRIIDPSDTDPREMPRNARRVKELIAFVDGHSVSLRRQAGVGQNERLDPWAVAPAFGLVFVQPENVDGVADEDRAHVSSLTAKQWSGMGHPLPQGGLLVMLNPYQTPERANVTAMEEVAHVYLGHKPVLLVDADGGCVQRHYDKMAEQEAYWLATATLLPSSAVGRAVWNGSSAVEIAGQFGVSTELVQFRIKTLRLWQDYQQRQGMRERERATA